MRALFSALLAAIMAALTLAAAAQERVPVVASFSILADFVRAVGGDRVEASALAPAGADAHVFTPTPADARRVAAAKLVVVNGLGFDGWMPRLLQAAGSKAIVVTATRSVTPRRRDGSPDPHAWQSAANAKLYVEAIRDALVDADPAGAERYRANAAAYLERLNALDRDIRAAVAKLPPERRRVISTHDAFGYFADAYGVAFLAPQGVSTEAEPTARGVAALIAQIRATKAPAVFLENVSDPRLMRRIASETGAKIGGTLYSDSLTGENGDAPTYIDMMRHNIKTLTAALAD